jgi:hypothetical protein
MKVSFLFNGKAKIILACESKKDEMLMQLARDAGEPAITYKGDNSLEIDFDSREKCVPTQQKIMEIVNDRCLCNGVGCNSCEPQGRG